MHNFGARKTLDAGGVAPVMVPGPVLLVSGSLRLVSTNAAALRTAAASLPPEVTRWYGGLATLPAFDPDDEVLLPAPVAALRDAVRGSGAVLFSVPEYAGTLPGALKNLLDWLVGDDHPRAIHDKPVGWLNVSPRGAAGAHAALRTVLGYVGADVVGGACVDAPVTSAMVGPDGRFTDGATVTSLSAAIGELQRRRV